MEELGLLEPLLPFLSQHLKASSGSGAQPLMISHMIALGHLIDEGFAADHAFVLGAMFFDFMRARRSRAERNEFDLLTELRLRGFARGDTERMRLVTDAFEHLTAPSRRTRRLMHRPYFAHARRFFEMVAPSYGIDIGPLQRFLNDPGTFFAGKPSGDDRATSGHRRRRRRRRHRRSRLPKQAGSDIDSRRASPPVSCPAPCPVISDRLVSVGRSARGSMARANSFASEVTSLGGGQSAFRENLDGWSAGSL
jgi:hypothetical protein